MLTGYIIEKYSNMTGAYSCNRLVEEGKKRGIDLRILGIADITVSKDGVYWHGKKVKPCDVVIYRYKHGKIKDAIGRLAKRTYNDTNDFIRYVNKYEQLRTITSKAFLIPNYMLGTGYTEYGEIVSGLGLPFVAKGLESAQGAEVYLIENKAQYQSLLKAYPLEKEYVFEQYIATSYGKDIRFYSVRGKVIAAMTREAVSGFKANVALGARVKEYPIDDTIRQAAKDIYDKTGLDFLGIDLLFGTDKPYFCEINVMPGMEGMEQATGVNVAGAIIDTILGDFK